MSKQTAHRRTFLRGVGISIALPPFESLRAAEPKEKGTDNATSATTTSANGSPAATRFVCIAPTYGMNPGGFFPSEVGEDYTMPLLLQPLKEQRDAFTVFTNLDHPGVGGGHGCSNTLLNGVELKDTRDKPARLHSLDQLLAESIGQGSRFPSLLLGSGGISWSRSGIPLSGNSDPSKVFTQLFVEENAKAKQRTRQFLDEDASILDVVRLDAKRLANRLAREDQRKLDQYITSIREVERKLARQAEWTHIAKPKIADDVIRGDDDRNVIVDLEYPYNTSVMYDLMVLALQTNSTKVICYGHPGGNRLFPFDGITLGYHSLTHHGQRPELLKELTIIESFYAREFARFLGKLSETTDTDGRSLLESTIVMFGSGMGNASSHSSRNLPIMVAGGGFRHGHHHRFDRQGRDGRPLCDLFVTFLQRLGIERDEFSTSTHSLNHVLL